MDARPTPDRPSATLRVTFLDNIAPSLERRLRDSVPASWRITMAAASGDVRAACREADVLLLIGASVNQDLVSNASCLRFIQKMGAGTDRIDLDACRRRRIGVARLAGGNATPVAEHALLMMLAALRQLSYFDSATRAGRWSKEEGRGVQRQLTGKQVGLVGFGAIGQQVARLLNGFATRTVFHDPAIQGSGPLPDLATPMPLDELLASSDVVSLHLPLMAETRGFLTRGRIGLMKPGAVLVNCARGGLVDEEALAEALEQGRIHGAGLDTFAAEPPIGSPLLASRRTVVTPHLAGATLDNFDRILAAGIANIEAFFAGTALPPGDLVLGVDP